MFFFLEKRNGKNSKIQKKIISIRDRDIKERIQMMMNVLNVNIYLSNKYQTNDIYSFSEANVFQ